MSKELENSTKIGRPQGSLNKRNQEIFHLAEQEGVSPLLIKIRLAGLKLKELGYKDEEIASLTTQEKIDIQDKNSNDLLPYFIGKRKPVDSQGNDSVDPLMDVLNELRGDR